MPNSSHNGVPVRLDYVKMIPYTEIHPESPKIAPFRADFVTLRGLNQ
jgi:hypothetical protein